MGVIKTILLAVLVIVGVGAGVIIASHYIPQEEWNGKKMVPEQLASFVTTGLSQIKLANLRSGVEQITGKVLGAHISGIASASASATESSKTSQSLPQKTFDFARYTYCKQVVTDYETNSGK